MSARTFFCQTEQDTELLGERVARLLFPHAFLALYGDLGAGKTAFARGVGRGLGTDEVASPTFTIVREHATELKLLHFDAYRVSGPDELFALGFDEYLSEEAVVLMEWAERAADCLPRERLDISIEMTENGGRAISMQPHGLQYERLVDAL